MRKINTEYIEDQKVLEEECKRTQSLKNDFYDSPAENAFDRLLTKIIRKVFA